MSMDSLLEFLDRNYVPCPVNKTRERVKNIMRKMTHTSLSADNVAYMLGRVQYLATNYQLVVKGHEKACRKRSKCYICNLETTLHNLMLYF